MLAASYGGGGGQHDGLEPVRGRTCTPGQGETWNQTLEKVRDGTCSLKRTGLCSRSVLLLDGLQSRDFPSHAQLSPLGFPIGRACVCAKSSRRQRPPPTCRTNTLSVADFAAL